MMLFFVCLLYSDDEISTSQSLYYPQIFIRNNSEINPWPRPHTYTHIQREGVSHPFSN